MISYVWHQVLSRLKYLKFFYQYLGYRLFVALVMSLAVGLLDGLGISLFVPVLQSAGGNSIDAAKTEQNLGGLAFIVRFFQTMHIELSVVNVLILMVVLFCSKGLARYISLTYLVSLQRGFIKKLRYKNLALVQELSYQGFSTMDQGRIQNTFTGEIEKIVRSFKSYFNTVLGVCTVLSYLFLALLTNPQFVLVVLVAAMLTNLVYRRIYKRTKNVGKDIITGTNQFQLQLVQLVANFKYLKATGLLPQYTGRLRRLVDNIEASQRKVGLMSAVLTSTREPLVVIVVVGVIIVQVLAFNSPIASIVLSLLFFYRSLSYMMLIQNSWNEFLTSTASIDNVIELNGLLSKRKELSGSRPLTSIERGIKVSDLSFSFGATQVVQNINLFIPARASVAFVGVSGAGKTTLVNLITGLLKPSGGHVFVDGEDLQDIDLCQYRDKIGYITQEPVIFDDTLFNNVTFWQNKTPENLERFWQAIDDASLTAFVQAQPEKEDFNLGGAGLRLSGGQRQRVTIAREFYKQPSIMILDEATSSLDSKTEKEVKDFLDSVTGRFITIHIAHRLSTIKDVDCIYVIGEGKIIASGTFHELIASSILFQKMIQAQNFHQTA